MKWSLETWGRTRDEVERRKGDNSRREEDRREQGKKWNIQTFESSEFLSQLHLWNFQECEHIHFLFSPLKLV